VEVDGSGKRREAKHSAGAQPGASSALYDPLMRYELGVVEHPAIRLPVPRRPTFLGSRTAPDESQVRRRLHEIRAASRRRKTYATCAAAAGTLLAVALAQRAALHAESGAR
jgi:hypothetical protein